MGMQPAILIFNPNSGPPGDAPFQLMQVIQPLQEQSIRPEVILTRPNGDLAPDIQAALACGVTLFIVSGGDGTLSAVACALAGSEAVMAIIPTGTQNNIALSLGIPLNLADALSLVGSGQPFTIDLGMVSSGDTRRPFIEMCSLGLISALFLPADEIQHGNLAGIGDFLSRFISTPGANIQLQLDDNPKIHTTGHSVLISNMPYFGPHFRIAPDSSCHDGLLDVMVFSDMTHLDLLDYALPKVDESGNIFSKDENPHPQHFHAQKAAIYSDPILPILVDGQDIGRGPLILQVQPQALKIMGGIPNQ